MILTLVGGSVSKTEQLTFIQQRATLYKCDQDISVVPVGVYAYKFSFKLPLNIPGRDLYFIREI